MKPYNAVGCDIFAGGFTLGVRRHFNVLGHLEHGSYGVRTARLNFPGLPVWVGKDTWPEKWKKVDLFYANPPCAIWSGANTRNTGDAWRRDPRTSCIRDAVGLLRHRPRALVWESTVNAWTRGHSLVRELAAAAMEQGYSVTHLLHDGQYLGLPQVRKRYFWIAHRMDFSPRWQAQLKEPVTVAQALKGIRPGAVLKDPPASFLKLWPKALPGKKVRNAMSDSDAIKDGFRKPGYFVVKVPHDTPCVTVMSGELMHWKQPRFLTFAEFKALCNYPHDFQLAKPSTGAMSELFRAVMPSTGAWIAANLRRAMDLGIPVNRPREYMVDIRKPDAVVSRELQP